MNPIHDQVHLIPEWITWQCQESTQQTLYNSVILGTNLYQWSQPLFDNFCGLYDNNKHLMIDSIQKHRGTLAEPGKNGMPMLTASYWYHPKAYHVQSVMYTGNDLSPESLNFIESPYGVTNIQPGNYFLINDMYVSIYYFFPVETTTERNDLNGVKIAIYKLYKGKLTLSAVNPNLRIFTHRDTLPPVITISPPSDPKTLQWRITDETFRQAWYTIDDGPQVPIDSTGTVTLNLTDKIQKIIVIAEDWFRLKTKVTTYRNATGIDGVEFAPKVTNYPNPFTDQITITNSGQMGQPVILMDMMGRVLYRTIMQGENLILAEPTIRALTTGTYILQVGDHKEKIVKVR